MRRAAISVAHLAQHLELERRTVRREQCNVLLHALDDLRIVLVVIARQLAERARALLVTPLVAEAALGQKPRGDGWFKVCELLLQLPQ